MNVHKNAPLTPEGRLRMVRRVLQDRAPHTQVALEFSTTTRTVTKWVRRYLQTGVAGLVDRSSRPHHAHPRALSAKTVRQIGLLRRRRWTIDRIAQRVNASSATVARYLKRMGLNRLNVLEPAPTVVRYERAEPGSLVHMDTKKLGRFFRPGHRVTGNPQIFSDGAGWEFAHVLIDDASRVSYVEVLPDERKTTVIGFFTRARAYLKSLGVEIQQLMTDNGSAYRSKLLAQPRSGAGPAPAHPTVPSTNQRQSGALHPNAATRMGLWAELPNVLPAHQSAVALATRLQLASATR